MKKSKGRDILKISFTALFLFVPAFSFAQTTFEPLAPLPGASGEVTFANYLLNFFQLLIGVAGLLAVLMIVVGGIQYIIGAGSPSARADAKKKITDAILGLLLALASWLILFTINPNILNIGELSVTAPTAPAPAAPVAPVNTAPSVALRGTSVMNVALGSAFNDPGVLAYDALDGNVTGSVVVNGTVNTAVAGTYTLTYTATDSSGLTTTVTRTVYVSDTVADPGPSLPAQNTNAPLLTLFGSNPLSVTIGLPFTDPGFTALDIQDGDLTSSVTVTGSVNVNTIGSYVLTYRVTDTDGNQTSQTRTVNVVDNITASAMAQDSTYLTACLGQAVAGSCAVADINGDGVINAVDITEFTLFTNIGDINRNGFIEGALGTPVAPGCVLKEGATVEFVPIDPDTCGGPFGWSSCVPPDNPPLSCANTFHSALVFDPWYISEVRSRLSYLTLDRYPLQQIYDDLYYCDTDGWSWSSTCIDTDPRTEIVFSTIAQFDLNNDDTTDFEVGSLDLAAFDACVGGSPTGSCEHADVNGDGNISYLDLDFLNNLIDLIEQGYITTSVSVGNIEAYTFDPQLYTDYGVLSYCLGRDLIGGCQNADVNFDGVINSLDLTDYNVNFLRLDLNGDGLLN